MSIPRPAPISPSTRTRTSLPTSSATCASSPWQLSKRQSICGQETAYTLRTKEDLISHALSILVHRGNVQAKAQLCNGTADALYAQLPSLLKPYLSSLTCLSPPPSQSSMYPSPSHIRPLLSSLILCGFATALSLAQNALCLLESHLLL